MGQQKTNKRDIMNPKKVDLIRDLATSIASESMAYHNCFVHKIDSECPDIQIEKDNQARILEQLDMI